MVWGCLAVVAIAVVQMGVIVRRAFVAPLGIGERDLVMLAASAAIGFVAWSIGLVTLVIGAAQ